MHEKILIFSSDAKTLYKADIFRALALPHGYTLQLRYPRQYVQSKFTQAPNTLANKDAVIFFVSGNDQSIAADKRQLEMHSIRECKIVEAFTDSINPEHLLVIVRLGNFVNCNLTREGRTEELPPYIFFGAGQISSLAATNWLERAQSIKHHFPKNTFYSLNAIKDMNGNDIAPTYSKARRLSYFPLSEESEYCIEWAYYDPSDINCSVKIDVSADAMDVRNPFEFGSGADLDVRRLPITTRTLKSRSAPAYLKIHVPDDKKLDPNYVELYFQIVRDVKKPFWFGCFVVLGVLGLHFAKSGIGSVGMTEDCLVDLIINIGDFVVKIIGLLCIGISAGLMFKTFHKV